jgi:hypothetical protein
MARIFQQCAYCFEKESCVTTVAGLVNSFGKIRHENDDILKNVFNKKGVEYFSSPTVPIKAQQIFVRLPLQVIRSQRCICIVDELKASPLYRLVHVPHCISQLALSTLLLLYEDCWERKKEMLRSFYSPDRPLFI